MNVSPVAKVRYFFPDTMGSAPPVLSVIKMGARSFAVRATLPTEDEDGGPLTGEFEELRVACLPEVNEGVDPWPDVTRETMMADAEGAGHKTDLVSLVGAQPGEERAVLFEDMEVNKAFWLYAVVTDNA